MIMSMARATLAVGVIAAAMVAGHTGASAQKWFEKDGIVIKGGQPIVGLFCQKAGSRKIESCTAAEAKAGADYWNAVRRQQQMQREMAAEARAYQKMTQDRQQRAPTTEFCYMKNGKLECKPS